MLKYNILRNWTHNNKDEQSYYTYFFYTLSFLQIYSMLEIVISEKSRQNNKILKQFLKKYSQLIK